MLNVGFCARKKLLLSPQKIAFALAKNCFCARKKVAFALAKKVTDLRPQNFAFRPQKYLRSQNLCVLLQKLLRLQIYKTFLRAKWFAQFAAKVQKMHAKKIFARKLRNLRASKNS